ncbi:hypothetical protein DIPPA_30146 [Diplonema papillatum]|nr:hypothetical protein DIPPA_30146 [Diplonema papillatum]
MKLLPSSTAPPDGGTPAGRWANGDGGLGRALAQNIALLEAYEEAGRASPPLSASTASTMGPASSRDAPLDPAEAAKPKLAASNPLPLAVAAANRCLLRRVRPPRDPKPDPCLQPQPGILPSLAARLHHNTRHASRSAGAPARRQPFGGAGGRGASPFDDVKRDVLRRSASGGGGGGGGGGRPASPRDVHARVSNRPVSPAALTAYSPRRAAAGAPRQSGASPPPGRARPQSPTAAARQPQKLQQQQQQQQKLPQRRPASPASPATLQKRQQQQQQRGRCDFTPSVSPSSSPGSPSLHQRAARPESGGNRRTADEPPAWPAGSDAASSSDPGEGGGRWAAASADDDAIALAPMASEHARLLPAPPATTPQHAPCASPDVSPRLSATDCPLFEAGGHKLFLPEARGSSLLASMRSNKQSALAFAERRSTACPGKDPQAELARLRTELQHERAARQALEDDVVRLRTENFELQTQQTGGARGGASVASYPFSSCRSLPSRNTVPRESAQQPRCGGDGAGLGSRKPSVAASEAGSGFNGETSVFTEFGSVRFLPASPGTRPGQAPCQPEPLAAGDAETVAAGSSSGSDAELSGLSREELVALVRQDRSRFRARDAQREAVEHEKDLVSARLVQLRKAHDRLLEHISQGTLVKKNAPSVVDPLSVSRLSVHPSAIQPRDSIRSSTPTARLFSSTRSVRSSF